MDAPYEVRYGMVSRMVTTQLVKWLCYCMTENIASNHQHLKPSTDEIDTISIFLTFSIYLSIYLSIYICTTLLTLKCVTKLSHVTAAAAAVDSRAAICYCCCCCCSERTNNSHNNNNYSTTCLVTVVK